MADKDTIWAYVKTVYDADGLVTLTNIRDRTASTADDAVGTAAALSVINYWPAYAQVAFDVTDGLHLEAAVEGVIAVLWKRGGAASGIEQVKWDTVFGEGGTLEKLRRTDPRGRQGPSTNSGIQTSRENDNGATPFGWSDRRSLPHGLLPGTSDNGNL
tara:strand:- start:23367 stop:23840 length:474 start_codon:yes stop_codon:yes gene_type:complete